MTLGTVVMKCLPIIFERMIRWRGGRIPYYDGDAGDYSYRRTRDDYDMNHSGHSMREKLEQMINEAGSDRERMALREALSKM